MLTVGWGQEMAVPRHYITCGTSLMTTFLFLVFSIDFHI